MHSSTLNTSLQVASISFRFFFMFLLIIYVIDYLLHLPDAPQGNTNPSSETGNPISFAST